MSEAIPPVYRRIVSIPFFLLGICAVLMAAALVVKTAVFHATSASAPGVIERIEPRPGKSMQYAPIYSFQDGQGRSHQEEGVWCDKDRWHQGESVRVLFDSNNPAESKLDCFHDIWMVPLLVSGIVCVYLFVMWCFWRSSRRRGGLWRRVA